MQELAAVRMEVAQDLWGLASAIDIYNCDPDIIRDEKEIRRFVVELCEFIDIGGRFLKRKSPDTTRQAGPR